MSIQKANKGDQSLSFDYGQEARSRGFNRIFCDLLPYGIYSGGVLELADASHINVTPLTCFIRSNEKEINSSQPDNVATRIQTSGPVSIEITPETKNTPYIVLRFGWHDEDANFMDICTVAWTDDFENTTGDPAYYLMPKDIILGKINFTDSGNVNEDSPFDLTRRQEVFFRDSEKVAYQLRVCTSEDLERKDSVYVTGGTVNTSKGQFAIAGQYVCIPPTDALPRVDLVAVNDKGEVIVVPAKEVNINGETKYKYENYKVLAEIHRGANRNDVTSADIKQVNDGTLLGTIMAEDFPIQDYNDNTPADVPKNIEAVLDALMRYSIGMHNESVETLDKVLNRNVNWGTQKEDDIYAGVIPILDKDKRYPNLQHNSDPKLDTYKVENALADIAGNGRTTETVKDNTDRLNAHIAATSFDTDTNGGESVHGSTADAIPNKIAKRDEEGKLKVATINDMDNKDSVANKEYVDEAKRMCINLAANAMIPVGFIYAQLPGMNAPWQVWTWTKRENWENITEKYIGLYAWYHSAEQANQKVTVWKRVELDGKDYFGIAKIYSSLSEMNNDIDNVQEGQFVLIKTDDPSDKDNSSVYIKRKVNDTDFVFDFVTNMLYAKGEKGDRGEQGIQGIPGVAGAKGERGDPFSIRKVYTSTVALEGDKKNPDIKDGYLVALIAKGDKNDGNIYIKSGDDFVFVANLGDMTAVKGDVGVQGSQGIQGEKGDKGDKGEQGIQGIQGLKGDKGEQGIQGAKGETGEKGEKGDAGQAFVIAQRYSSIDEMNDRIYIDNVPQGQFVMISSVPNDPDNCKLYIKRAYEYEYISQLVGAKGDKGDIGDAGADAGFGNITATYEDDGGNPGVDITATGDNTAKNINLDFKNLRGDRGLKGDTGEPAGFGTPTANIDAGVGTPGVIVTAQGNDTAKVFNFDFKNLKGEQGVKGDKGDKGEAPEISIGTVTTLDCTDAPTVAVRDATGDSGSETYKKYEIDMGLPQMPVPTADVEVNQRIGTPSVTVTNTGTVNNPCWKFSFDGVKGEPGKDFKIAKVYPSIADMTADYTGTDVEVGEFSVIDTGNIGDEDNAKLYLKGETQWMYITDLSGATGLQGPKGETGDVGPQGPKGDTPTDCVNKSGDTITGDLAIEGELQVGSSTRLNNDVYVGGIKDANGNWSAGSSLDTHSLRISGTFESFGQTKIHSTVECGDVKSSGKIEGSSLAVNGPATVNGTLNLGSSLSACDSTFSGTVRCNNDLKTRAVYPEYDDSNTCGKNSHNYRRIYTKQIQHNDDSLAEYTDNGWEVRCGTLQVGGQAAATQQWIQQQGYIKASVSGTNLILN